MRTDTHKGGRAVAAVGMGGILIATGLWAPPAGAEARATTERAAASGGCRLVRLADPRWGHDSGVMDIERIGRRVVYYGNTQQRVDGVDHQRALVWMGRRATPYRVGPRGWDDDTALELTDSGLVNGVSQDWESGRAVAWIQDLATDRIRLFDADSGPRGTDRGYPWIRRINRVGAAAGQVSRSADPEVFGADAVGFRSPFSRMRLLNGSRSAEDAGAFGINDAGVRVGYLGTDWLPSDPEFLIYDAMRWNRDGSVTELVSPRGLDAIARNVKNDGAASGLMMWGNDPTTAHVEAAYWPSPRVNIALGVLNGGGFSDALGMDEGGWLVGFADRFMDVDARFATDGLIMHSFLWNPETTDRRIRILPSLYGARHGLGWKKWVGSAVHAVNAQLNQAASASHWRFDGARLVDAATVYLNADRCGREVATTHDPFGLGAQRRIGAGRGPVSLKSAVGPAEAAAR